MCNYNINTGAWSDIVYDQFLSDGAVLDLRNYFHNTIIVVAGGFNKIGDNQFSNIALLSYTYQVVGQAVVYNYDWLIDFHDFYAVDIQGVVSNIVTYNETIIIGGSFYFNQSGELHYTIASFSIENGWENLHFPLKFTNTSDPIATIYSNFIHDLELSSDAKYLYVSGKFLLVNNFWSALFNYFLLNLEK